MKIKALWISGTLIVIGVSLWVWGTWAGPNDPAPKDAIAQLYRVLPQPAVTVIKGAKGATHFNILLKKNAKIHPKAPFGCQLTATTGLKLAKERLGRTDTQPSKNNRDVKIPLRFAAQKKGQQAVTASCHFFICTKEICARREEKVNLKVQVK